MGINNMSTLKLAHLKEQNHIVILRKMNLWSLTITNRIVCVANDKNNNDKRYSTNNEMKKNSFAQQLLLDLFWADWLITFCSSCISK